MASYYVAQTGFESLKTLLSLPPENTGMCHSAQLLVVFGEADPGTGTWDCGGVQAPFVLSVCKPRLEGGATLQSECAPSPTGSCLNTVPADGTVGRWAWLEEVDL